MCEISNLGRRRIERDAFVAKAASASGQPFKVRWWRSADEPGRCIVMIGCGLVTEDALCQ